MKKALLLVVITVFVKISMACLNETHKDKYGRVHIRDEQFMVYNEPDKASATAFLAKYDLNKLDQYDKDVQSDIAVNLTYIGKYDKALSILKKLQKANPVDYNIAANLGTVYELSGNNELALQFIKEGIQLNQNSHEGSEWVHVKIVEAKLQIAKDPSWLQSHRVLNTGVSFKSKNNSALGQKIWHIEYQLHERVPFTPFPDKLLANVFDELGDLYATQESAEMAYMAYDFSLKYDPADNYAATQKMEELKAILKKQKTKIPSWKNYYYNRKLSKIQAEIADEVINTVANPEKLEKKIGGFKSMVDVLTGEKARREKKRRQKNIIIGSSAAVLLLAGVIGYIRKRKVA